MLQLNKIKLFFFKESLSVNLNDGEILGILGPSGCGKTSLLKSIKGFFPKEGTVLLNNEIINNNKDSRIGLVHQQPIMFPHWSVKENLIFGNLLIKKQSENEIHHKLNKICQQFQLNNILNKQIKNLSVGEKQRLSIVRCLMMDPKIILMDEPSSALDPINIKKLCNIINKLKESGVSMIIASHDLTFIKKVTDKIIFLAPKGNILFNGKNEDFWKSSDDTIKEFIDF